MEKRLCRVEEDLLLLSRKTADVPMKVKVLGVREVRVLEVGSSRKPVSAARGWRREPFFLRGLQLGVGGRLQSEEFCVDASARYELLVCALFGDASVFDHDDQV